ncbi:hypothetical protein Tco_0283027 [Tanacetum coccineum]
MISSCTMGLRSFFLNFLSVLGPGDSSSRRSTMKSDKICPFTDVLGLYCMSYSPSSILHLCILHVTSGFDSTCLIGWSVMTMIGCAWNYLFSLLLAIHLKHLKGYPQRDSRFNSTFWGEAILKRFHTSFALHSCTAYSFSVLGLLFFCLTAEGTYLRYVQLRCSKLLPQGEDYCHNLEFFLRDRMTCQKAVASGPENHCALSDADLSGFT